MEYCLQISIVNIVLQITNFNCVGVEAPPICIGGNGDICEQLRFVNNHKVADECSTNFCANTTLRTPHLCTSA